MSFKILFILAHPDDEAYGPYGTIVKSIRDGHPVSVYSLCNGARPGSEHVSRSRIDNFLENCRSAGADHKIFDKDDLTLELKETTNLINSIIEIEKPDIIYTHNISDLHLDHRIVAEACLVASRPKPGSSVKQIYFSEIPGSTDWTFNQIQPQFIPNTYVSLDDSIVELKNKAMSRYTTEIYDYPDARSTEAMYTLLKYRGYQSGVNYAEAFKLVFCRQ